MMEVSLKFQFVYDANLVIYSFLDNTMYFTILHIFLLSYTANPHYTNTSPLARRTTKAPQILPIQIYTLSCLSVYDDSISNITHSARMDCVRCMQKVYKTIG